MFKKFLNSNAPGFFIAATVFAVAGLSTYIPVMQAGPPVTDQELFGVAVLSLFTIFMAAASAFCLGWVSYEMYRTFSRTPAESASI